jgi:hypothetical protein
MCSSTPSVAPNAKKNPPAIFFKKDIYFRSKRKGVELQAERRRMYYGCSYVPLRKIEEKISLIDSNLSAPGLMAGAEGFEPPNARTKTS